MKTPPLPLRVIQQKATSIGAPYIRTLIVGPRAGGKREGQETVIAEMNFLTSYDKEHAEFFCKAANMHGDLIQLLKDIDFTLTHGADSWDDMREKIAEMLDKAKGK